MRPVRILQMPMANARGGVTRYALENFRFLDKERFSCGFATVRPHLDFAPEVERSGGKIHYISCSSLADETRFIAEFNAILDQGYDVVHLHTCSWTGFWAEKLALERGCPMVIVHAHSAMVDIFDDRERQQAIALHERLKREFHSGLATHFCACSTAAAHWLFGPGIPPERIQILNNAIDVDAYAFDPAIRKRVRGELGLADTFAIGHIGRFTYLKNHGFLLDVFSRVTQSIPAAVLVLIGDGPLQPAMRRYARELGIGDKVRFLGTRDDVPEVMQALDVYAHPSHFEGLGLVLVEAQAAGLPCLTSQAVPPEAKVSRNIRFIELDAAAWEKEILNAAGRPIDRSRAAEEVAAAGYGLKDQIRVIETLYASAVDS